MTPIVPLLSGSGQSAAPGAAAAQGADAAQPFTGLLAPLLAQAEKAGLKHALIAHSPGQTPDQGKTPGQILPDDLSQLTPQQQRELLTLLAAGDGEEPALPLLTDALKPGPDAVAEHKPADDGDDGDALAGLPAALISLLATLRGASPETVKTAATTPHAADAASTAVRQSLAALTNRQPAATVAGTHPADAQSAQTPHGAAADAVASRLPPALAGERPAGTEQALRLPAAEQNIAPLRAEQPAAPSVPLPLTQAAQSQPAAEATAPPLLSARLGSPEWQQALSQQVLLFNRNGQQQAELRLHPRELGSVQISLSINDNQAQLHLVSAHSQVRAALESALPQLRTALAESGIQLGQSSVGSDAQPQWGQNGGTQHNAGAFGADAAPPGESAEQPISVMNISRHDGRVDIAV